MLALYLLLFATGAAVGSRLVRRTIRPARWFLGIQVVVGVTGLAGLLALVELPRRLGLYGSFESHFAVDGYNLGGQSRDPADRLRPPRGAAAHHWGARARRVLK